jgi:branched-chain amino acid transport system permease protein
MSTLRRSGRRPPWVLLPLALAGLTMAYPWMGGGPFWTRQIILIAVLSLTVSGLNLSFGYAGELALGQVAMYAAGAYVAGYFAAHGRHDLVFGIIVGAIGALIVGLASGIPGLRLGGWSLAMVSFFLVLLVPDILSVLHKQTGGFDGLVGIANPRLFGITLTAHGFYVATLVIAVVWFAILRNLINSRHGASFLVLRQSPVLASSLGIPVYWMKLTAYALGAIPAGVAGALFAYLNRFLDPTSFGFDYAIVILAASVLGGAASVYGAVAGAIIMQLGPLRTTGFQKYADLVYGGFLILSGILLSQGLAGLARPFLRRFLPSARVSTVSLSSVAPESSVAADSSGAPDRVFDPVPGDILEVTGVSKHFGGLHALQDVSLRAQPGRITAIIGPNGSGKTTLLNIISGFYRPDEGSIRLGDDDLHGLSSHTIARRGVARTFQTPLIPEALTTAETVATGRYGHVRISMLSSILRLPSFWRARNADGAEAVRTLRLVGIPGTADQEAASLPLGTRRLVEVARALAAAPRVLLFDEVASGLDQGDLDNLAAIMRAIRDAGATVLLVEHNFRLVLELADEIFVLANGRLLASGTPDEIAAHPGVLEQYLGVRSVRGTESAPPVVVHPGEEASS